MKKREEGRVHNRDPRAPRPRTVAKVEKEYVVRARWAATCSECREETVKRDELLKGPRGWGHRACIAPLLRQEAAALRRSAGKAFRARSKRRRSGN